MDEPTAQLPDDERDVLLEQIRKMRARGVAVLLVTHRLEEVLATADRVTVFRDGQWIDTTDIAKTDLNDIITKMVGREVGSIAVAAARSADQPLAAAAPEALRVEGLSNGVLNDVSLTLKVGEVLGIGGLAGSGRTELARAIIGADPIDSGEIWVGGEKAAVASPADAINAASSWSLRNESGWGSSPALTLRGTSRSARRGRSPSRPSSARGLSDRLPTITSNSFG